MSPAADKNPLSLLILILAVAGVYYVAAIFGLSLATRAEQVTLIWPPTGIALAVLLLFGHRLWPGVLAGAFLANMSANEPVVVAAGIATGNTLEAVIGAWLINHYIPSRDYLGRTGNVLRYSLVAAACSVVAATVGVSSLCLGGVQAWQQFFPLWMTWWLGDTAGAMIVAPLLLVWTRPAGCAMSPGGYIMAAVVAVVFCLAGAVIFAAPTFDNFRVFPYLLFPLVIWLALRYGQRGVTLGTLAISSLAVWATVNGSGPFSGMPIEQALFTLQLFTVILAATGMLLGAAVAEREDAWQVVVEAGNKTRLVLDHAGEAVISYNENLLITEWNRRAEEMFGWSPQEAKGRPVDILLPAGAARRALREWAARFARDGRDGLADTCLELDVLHKSGNKFPAEWTVTPYRYKDECHFTAFVRDITERRRNEQLARESEQRLERQVAEFETLLEVIPVGIGIALDRECRTVRVNPAFAGVLGLDRDQNASKTAPEAERPVNFRCLDLQGNEVADDQLPMQVAAREGRIVSNVELDIVHQDGRVIRLLEYAAPLFDEAGLPRGSVGAFVDMTGYRKAEAHDRFLVELDGRIHPLVQPEEIAYAATAFLGSPIGADRCVYADIGTDGITINIIANYSRNESIRDIAGEYRLDDFGTEAVRCMRENRPHIVTDVQAHLPVIENPETYRSVQVRSAASIPLHKRGRLVAMMSLHASTPRTWREEEVELLQLVANRCWESLARARMERSLRESEELFRQLANSIPQLCWMARPDGWIFWYNDRWYEYTGETSATMQGWGWEKVHDPIELKRVRRTWGDALAGGTPWEDIFPLRRHDGEMRWHLSRAMPVRDQSGDIILWFGSNTDVTEQRRLQDEREQLLQAERTARATAEQNVRMKDEFLATLSHELRTPLNAILGWSQVLQLATPDQTRLKEGLAAIERNSRIQTQLIEDLLDMSRIITGKIRLHIQRVNLADVIDHAVEVVRPAAEAKAVRMATELPAAPCLINGDPGRLQQVLWNLLSNAIKFTPAFGSVRIVLDASDDHAEIHVIDTGQGIDADFLPHVFERFRQADGSLVRQHSGLGLGLAIVKQLVDLHSGSVRVSSDGPRRGAEFVIRLPRNPASQEEDDPLPGVNAASAAVFQPVAAGLAGLNILVVDDNRDAREMTHRLLEDRGAKVALAGSGEEALDLVRSGGGFNLLICDIGMPGMDGYELLRRLRGLPHGGGAFDAIALTAFARPEDRSRSLQEGFGLHLVKPVEPAELIAVCAELMERLGIAPEPARG